MKLRMRGNTVRLRLTRSEVAEFADTGEVRDTVEFPSGALGYRIQRSSSSAVAADFTDHTVSVSVPESLARQWVSTGQVGIEACAGALNILIEKDFPCAHGEPDLDAFQPEQLS